VLEVTKKLKNQLENTQNQKKSKMDPIFWFDVSRIILISAGLFTAVGGYGVLHFGRINSLNQNTEIAASTKVAAMANKDAAEANRIAAIANKDAETAKLQANKAQSKTIENENTSKSLSIQLEKEKQKTIQAKRELDELKKETQNIKIETDRIRTIEIYLLATFQGEFDKSLSNGIHSPPYGAKLSLEINNSKVISFVPGSNMQSKKISENSIQFQIDFVPIDMLSVNRLPIEKLNEIESMQISVSQELLKTSTMEGFKQSELIRYEMMVVINGIETLILNTTEKKIGDFAASKNQIIGVNSIFKDAYTSYKNKTGRNDK